MGGAQVALGLAAAAQAGLEGTTRVRPSNIGGERGERTAKAVAAVAARRRSSMRRERERKWATPPGAPIVRRVHRAVANARYGRVAHATRIAASSGLPKCSRVSDCAEPWRRRPGGHVCRSTSLATLSAAGEGASPRHPSLGMLPCPALSPPGIVRAARHWERRLLVTRR